MALRALQGPTGGGTPVGGTGITNTIPRWTGPSTLGDSGLTDDGSVITSSRRFDVTNLSGIRVGTGADYLRLSQSGTTSFIDALSTNGTLRFRVNAGGTDAIFASAAGNVGIGTASPGTRLDVANAGNVIVRAQNTASNSDAQFNAVNTFGTATFGINNVGGYALTASAIPFLFYTNNTERARIDSSGSVCINTTNARTSRFSVEQTGTGTKLATFSNAVDADFEIKSASAGLLTIGTGTGTLAIQSGGTERMRVSNSGVASASQVAIGTSSFTSGCSLTVAQSIDVSQSAQGLKLPATPGNADTQTLDAYRENTFTPTIQGGTTAGVGTYTSQIGTFTIIGRCLFFNVEIAWSAHTGTGVVQLAGLPVAAAQLATFGLDSNYAAAGYLRMSAGNTYAQINTINVPATGNYRVSGCYFIA